MENATTEAPWSQPVLAITAATDVTGVTTTGAASSPHRDLSPTPLETMHAEVPRALAVLDAAVDNVAREPAG